MLIRIFLFLFIVLMSPAYAETLNIYSYRQPELLRPFLEAYEQQTGTKFQTVYAPKGLVARLKAEGPNSPADLVLTVDISRNRRAGKSRFIGRSGF